MKRWRGPLAAGRSLRCGWFLMLLGFVLVGSGCRPPEPAATQPGPLARPVGVPEPDVSAIDPKLAALIQTGQAQVRSQPASGEAWGRLGQAFEAAEFLDEAQVCYGRAVEQEPASPRWLHLLALRELGAQPEQALTHLRMASQLTGPPADASRLRWVQALVERGRWTEATAELTPWLAEHPEHPAARLEMARVLVAQGQAEAGLPWLGPCLTNPYTARPALLLLSQARLRVGDADGATAAARKAASMPRPFDWPDPYLREVHALHQDRQRLAEQANRLLMQQRLPEAEARLQTLLGEAPQDAEGWLVMGRLRLQQRRLPEAETALKRHLEIRPDSLNGLIQLGMALAGQARWPEAGATFERAVALKPDFAQAHFNLCLARAGAGDLTGAQQAIREALRCNPGDAAALAVLAELHLQAGQMTEGRAALTEALRLDPNQPRARALAERLNR
jgi:tetratricopeptide (TPR) repeat protein